MDEYQQALRLDPKVGYCAIRFKHLHIRCDPHRPYGFAAGQDAENGRLDESERNATCACTLWDWLRGYLELAIKLQNDGGEASGLVCRPAGKRTSALALGA